MYSGYKPVLTARPLPQCGGLPAGRREDPGRGIRPHRGQGDSAQQLSTMASNKLLFICYLYQKQQSFIRLLF